MRSSGATVLVAALALVGAGPAAAVTGGFGVAAAAQSAHLTISTPAEGKKKAKLASCHASELGQRGTGAQANLGKQIGSKAAPVACEQPPRSQLVLPDALKHATAAALAILG